MEFGCSREYAADPQADYARDRGAQGINPELPLFRFFERSMGTDYSQTQCPVSAVSPIGWSSSLFLLGEVQLGTLAFKLIAAQESGWLTTRGH